MQKLITKTAKTMKKFSGKALSAVLLVALLVQMTALMCSAALSAAYPIWSQGNGSSGIVNGVGRLESDELVAQLKKDFLGTINKDLISKVEDHQLKGETQVIITFSDQSLVQAYNDYSAKSGKMTFTEFCRSSTASKYTSNMIANQKASFPLFLMPD